MPIENRKYKDTVFRMLFNNKMHLLELYNAINGTNYKNPDDLEITTLAGETFLKMKNDLSFIIDFELNLYEHQSTICPNVPLRNLYYLASTLKERIPQEKTYSRQRIQIPTPRFYVFYNGTTNLEDTVTYRLSEMFSRPVGDPSIELVVTVLNVNHGHNKELMELCKALKGYSIFVSKVRQYNQEAREAYDASHVTPLKLLADKTEIDRSLIRSAVNKAIDECIEENILHDFFTEYRKEVIEVSIHEYSYERHLQLEKDESYNSGFDSGHDDGIRDTNELYSWLYNNGRDDDVKAAAFDPDFLSKLFAEYEAWKQS